MFRLQSSNSYPSSQINSRSIQDLHIFGDPSRIPIVIVERVVNAPRRTVSVNSYFHHTNLKDYSGLLSGPSYEDAKKPSTQQNGRVLKVVVFVHGFQACFPVPCSSC